MTDTTEQPAEAIAAEARQLAVNIAAAFEPDAVRIIDGNPDYLISALLECTRRVMDAVAPLIAARAAAAQLERIRHLANPGTLRLLAAQLAFDDKPGESSNMYALADLLAARDTP